MAFIQDDDKLLDDPNQPQPQATGGGAPTTISQGSSSADVGGGGGVSTAGVGAGGTGGWTNIQAYLDANKGDTGSAQALDRTVSDQFGKEKDAYTQASSKFLGDAQSKVDADKIDNTKADEMIGHAKDSYSWGGNDTNTGYQDNVGKMRSALTGSYGGPKDYSYGFDNQTQEYGNSLKDPGGFNQLMGHIYQNAAGGPLSSGQLNLQKQLDVNNSNLVDKKKELAGKYDQLGADRDQVVANTTTGLGDLEKQYRVNQNQLQDYLTGKSNSYGQEIGQAEADARKAYNHDYSTTGDHTSSFLNPSDRDISTYLGGFGGLSSGSAPLQRADIWGDGGKGLTWKQLQGENDFSKIDDIGTGLDEAVRANGSDIRNKYLANQKDLKNFYSTQDTKYKDTADEQERAFNSIQDFLNSTAARKEQGFKVRG